MAQLATFAGGCFWCTESAFRHSDVPGILEIKSGYTGGTVKKPTYEQVSSGRTGHCEAIQITFDPEKVKYQDLVEFFWKTIDPTDETGQFADRGSQYRTAIFWHSDEQRKIAEAAKKKLGESGQLDKPIATSIEPAGAFYEAEDYHQGYSDKNPLRYDIYRRGSGRAEKLRKIWQ